jgi:hypothetical protein
MNPDFSIRRVSSVEVVPVRQQELRPGYAIEACVFDHDDDADTAHWGAFRGKEMVGVASVYRRAAPGADDPCAWQIRGIGPCFDSETRPHWMALLFSTGSWLVSKPVL